MAETIAVLDVGKTNKKVSLYDRAFQVLDEERTTIASRMLNGLEVEDTDALLAFHVTGQQRQRPGDHFGERRFARAVDAKKPDAVVNVEPQIEVAQHGSAVVADGRALKLN